MAAVLAFVRARTRVYVCASGLYYLVFALRSSVVAIFKVVVFAPVSELIHHSHTLPFGACCLVLIQSNGRVYIYIYIYLGGGWG